MTARDVAKAEAAAAAIRASTGNAKVDVMALSLDVPDSVRAFAKAYLAGHPKLNLLINNAGVMACPLARTGQGWEMQFGTNHLGHFLLTALLAPALVAGAPARVVNVSSGGHHMGSVDFDDPHYERRPYEKWNAYGQAKTANILHAVELDRRLAARGVRAFAIHPGMILTELGRHLTPDDGKLLMERAKQREQAGLASRKSVEQGAATQVWAATAPELEGRGGLYCEDCQISGVGVPGVLGAAPYALDPANARRLWELSERTLGETFAV
jgi:NAD(P)-dependent dehydrogenase (short-subunit alcohol dehydrogenase family)